MITAHQIPCTTPTAISSLSLFPCELHLSSSLFQNNFALEIPLTYVMGIIFFISWLVPSEFLACSHLYLDKFVTLNFMNRKKDSWCVVEPLKSINVADKFYLSKLLEWKLFYMVILWCVLKPHDGAAKMMWQTVAALRHCGIFSSKNLEQQEESCCVIIDCCIFPIFWRWCYIAWRMQVAFRRHLVAYSPTVNIFFSHLKKFHAWRVHWPFIARLLL